MTGASRSMQSSMPGLFCHDANWVLAHWRGQRIAFSSSRAVCAADRLKLAMQIMSIPDASRADLQRARTLVNSVLNGMEVEHDASLAGLASFLERGLSERRRLDDRLEKQSVTVQDQQQQINDLAKKISALTDLEQSMAQRRMTKRMQSK